MRFTMIIKKIYGNYIKSMTRDINNSFVHLHCHTPYSFMDGASTIESLIKRAVDFGMPALAITDHNNLCGAIKFYKEARKQGIKPIIGTELTLEGDNHITLLAENAIGYSNLCQLLTTAHLSQTRGKPSVTIEQLAGYRKGLIVLSGCRKSPLVQNLLKGRYSLALEIAQRFSNIFGRENFFLELQSGLLPGNKQINNNLKELGEALNLSLVASNNCHYADKKDFLFHDLLICIREGIRLRDIHKSRPLNGENYLKSSTDMFEEFKEYPEALVNTFLISERCQEAFKLNQHLFPHYSTPEGKTAVQYLIDLTYKGAERRYGRLTLKAKERLDYELNIIAKLGFADYFLLVKDAVNHMQQQGIRYAGRGSAADSAVAFALGITEVDSIERDLLFERFMSLERAQKPDIDIDIDARFRDQVADYLYKKYGDEHVATVCTYNTFQARSALRELGKVMDFSLEEIGALAKKFPHFAAERIEEALEKLPELRNSKSDFSKYKELFAWAQGIDQFPRFIGTHLGGIVVASKPLAQLVPLERSAKGVVVTQFDKDFIEDLGLVKLDLLSLRTLSVIQDSVESISLTEKNFSAETLPLGDKKTYELLGEGKSIGVFQLESPAQRALQSRLEPSELEDIIASVALIRPGPIKGNMVDPFIERRHQLQEVTYLHPLLEPILSKTYGVILFQEQVLQIAIAIAGFTPGEADKLRKVMTHARSQEEMKLIGKSFVEKAVLRGIEVRIAEEIFASMAGYASYGFCEAHAVAFGTTAYKTAYLLAHYPAEFFTALLNHQPMGYYPAGTLIVEARSKGINILGVDINKSLRNFTVEEGRIRVGLKQIANLQSKAIDYIVAARKEGTFSSWENFCSRVIIDQGSLEGLVKSGAFDSLDTNRRKLLWYIHNSSPQAPSCGADSLFEEIEPYVAMENFSYGEKLMMEYSQLGFSAQEHIMGYWRRKNKFFLRKSIELKSLPQGAEVEVGGLVIRPHRPPTKSGNTIVFLALEDEFGLTDVTVFNKTYQKYGQLIFGDYRGPLKIRGKIERRGKGISVVARDVKPLFS